MVLRRQLLAWLVLAAGAGSLRPAEAAAERTLVILGDSLTAGYGLDRPDDEAFPARLQALCDGAKLPWKIVAAGLSGDTTAGGLRRIDWILRRRADGVIVALGGNDGLRGIPPDATRANLVGIVAKIRGRYPGARIWIAGMQMPANMGPEYVAAYRALFPAVARETGSGSIPFLLEGVGGVADLNQSDGIHPTATGHGRIAETVWRAISGDLKEAAAAGNSAAQDRTEARR